MIQPSQKFANQVRTEVVKMIAAAKASHIGGALSMADLLSVLYGEILRVKPEQPDWPERDRFILSKGHSCTGVYATLALRGFFPLAELATYGQDGSRLMSHISHKVPGVEFSTGSLGHGLGFACGKALAAQRQKKNWRVFTMLSDGELDEGSNWEAILFAPHHRLDNLVAIMVDTQSRIWFGSSSMGLLKFNGDEWVNDPHKNGISAAQVNALQRDSGGNLWFATDKGLLRMNNPYPY